MFILPVANEIRALAPTNQVEYHLTMVGARIVQAAVNGWNFGDYTMHKATGNLIEDVAEALRVSGYDVEVRGRTISIKW